MKPVQIPNRARQRAFSLTEVVASLAVTGIMIGGVVSGFRQTTHQSEWSAYSLAAQGQALRGLEQVRAAKWDPQAWPVVDQVLSSNFPERVEILDVPTRPGNITYATNRTTITTVSENPPLRLIRVDCTWPFMNRGVFSNTALTYRVPDQ